MPRIEVSRDVATDPDALWHAIGSFQGVGDWHPMLTAVEGDGEQPGAVRRAVGGDGSEQIERLETVDPARRQYRYAIESSSLPVRDYRGQLGVQGKGDGTSTVRWVAEFETPRSDEDETVGMVREFLETGVHAIAERFAA